MADAHNIIFAKVLDLYGIIRQNHGVAMVAHLRFRTASDQLQSFSLLHDHGVHYVLSSLLWWGAGAPRRLSPLTSSCSR